MRKLGKSLLILVMLICMFGYMRVVDAADANNFFEVEKDAEVQTAVKNMLSGKVLSQAEQNTINGLLSKYEFYYQYKDIDSTLYSQYKTGASASTSQIIALITAPATVADLKNSANGWQSITSPQISYSGLNFSAENPGGYYVVLYAVPKGAADTSTVMYYSRDVYQATSATTLATYSSIANGTNTADEEATNNVVNKQETVDKEEVEKKETNEVVEKAETNPETGISDFAMYLVPFSLVAGSALMIKRRHA